MARGPASRRIRRSLSREMARSVSMSNSQRNERLPILERHGRACPGHHVVPPAPPRASGTTRMAGTSLAMTENDVT